MAGPRLAPPTDTLDMLRTELDTVPPATSPRGTGIGFVGAFAYIQASLIDVADPKHPQVVSYFPPPVMEELKIEARKRGSDAS